jgi:hypothetical protein
MAARQRERQPPRPPPNPKLKRNRGLAATTAAESTAAKWFRNRPRLRRNARCA